MGFNRVVKLADREAQGEAITPPGLPASVEQPKDFISKDCVRAGRPPAGDPSTTESYAAAAHFHALYETPPPYGVK